MAAGDQQDMTTRLLGQTPDGWFPSVAPRLYAVLQGPAAMLSAAYGLLAFVKAQGRVSSAQGAFLDLAARDFFGDRLPRLLYEQDEAYAARIKFNLTAPRGTKPGMMEMLTELTGRPPIIFQPNDPRQTGGLATPSNFRAGGSLPFALGGAGAAGSGALGTLTMPAQVMITAYRPTTGLAVYGYYGGLASPSNFSAGLGVGLATPSNFAAGQVTSGGQVSSFALVNPNTVPGELTDDDIYQQIADWTAAGYVSWVRLK